MKVQNSPLCPSEISGKTCTSLECVGWQPEHIWGSQFVAQVKEALKEKVGYLQRFSFPRHLNTAIKWWPWRTLSSPHCVALPAVQCWSTCAESLSGSLFSDTPWHCPLWQWLPGCFLFQNSACLLIFINKYHRGWHRAPVLTLLRCTYTEMVWCQRQQVFVGRMEFLKQNSVCSFGIKFYLSFWISNWKKKKSESKRERVWKSRLYRWNLWKPDSPRTPASPSGNGHMGWVKNKETIRGLWLDNHYLSQ